jgi:hypothetical protein
VEFEVARGIGALLIADGLQEQRVDSGAFVRVSRSPLTATFLRVGDERQAFYANLARRLGWLRIDHALGPDARGESPADR